MWNINSRKVSLCLHLAGQPEAAIKLIRDALDTGIAADYVLMDTWFTTEPMIASVLVVVKQLKQQYYFNGKTYTLPELQKFVNYNGVSNIFGSLFVTTKKGIPVKIDFVRNRNKKSECLYIKHEYDAFRFRNRTNIWKQMVH